MKAALRYTALWAFMLPALTIFSQNISLKLVTAKKSEASKLNYRKKFQTKEAAYHELENVILTLQYKGYLLASADTIYSDTSSITATVSENQLFRLAHLKLGNLNPNLASKLGISEKLYFNKPFKYTEVAKSFEKIIAWYENNGYPFVAISIDSVAAGKEQLSGIINVQKNKLFKIDSVKIMGNAKVSYAFIRRYLSVKEGMPYNEEILKSISQKIKQLPFVTEQQSQVVRLTNKTNKLILFLDKKDASQFDGIIGLLPDANTKKTVITGDVKLKIVNGVFKSGETFNLEWRRLQSQTQDLNAQVTYPYLFGTPIGLDYNIKLYRKDTSFIDINNNFGVQYYFNGLNSFKIFYSQRNTNLISSNGLSMVTTLPDYADIATQSYGAGVNFEKLDYRFNPHRGISLVINGQAGNRVIKKNPKINEVAYDGLLLRSTQYQVNGTINYYIQLSGNHVLRLGMQGASIFGNSTLFRNELFRIGGLKTLRGFDEETIYTSTYVIPTLEYRFLFAKNSNLLLFTEGAWYENNSGGTYLHDTPMTVGAGVNFETKAGILTLDYAIGNQLGSGFDARNGKIHFGLTALF